MVTEYYKNYLKSPRWAAKRQAVFKHYGKRCYACGKRAKIIQVHHRSYKKLGNEPLSHLIPVCVPCHKRITAFHRKNRRRGIERNTAYMIKLIRKEKGTSR